MKKHLVLAVAVFMIIVVPVASAQRVRASAPPSGETVPVLVDPAQVAAALAPCLLVTNLTPTQALQMQGILAGAQPVFTQLGQRISADQAALVAASSGSNVDSCAVGAAFMKRQASLDALGTEVRLVRTQIAAILTPEQMARLEGCIAGLVNFGPKP